MHPGATSGRTPGHTISRNGVLVGDRRDIDIEVEEVRQAIARPLASVAAFALVIALWALIHGIVRIFQAFDLRSRVPHWWIVLVTGIIDRLWHHRPLLIPSPELSGEGCLDDARSTLHVTRH